jgi:hypothetical protein
MNKRIVIGMAIVAMAATAVQAVTYTAANDGLWSTTTTWSPVGTPGTAALDIVRLGAGKTVTLDSSVANAMGNINIGRSLLTGNLIVNSGGFLGLYTNSTINVGDGGVGTLVMNGGTITGKTFKVSNGGVATANSSATIHGGTIGFNGAMTIGAQAAGSLTIDGGSVIADKLFMGTNGAAFAATTTLTGGTLEVTGAGASAFIINSASQFNIGGTGNLILNGDAWGIINGYVNSQDIVWNTGTGVAGVGDRTWHSQNGTGYLHSDYDSLTGKTTVWVNETIPEPATVGMLGLGSLIVLLVRRMRG